MTTTPTAREDHRLHPLRALAALRRLIRDPEDTEQVFHIMQALAGRTLLRNLARLRRLRPDLLARREEIIDLLADRDWLASLPEGSLGRAYLAFCTREGITPEGLVQASAAAGRRETDSEVSWMQRRGRDTHDLWHVVTGYGTHPVGEVCVVAFSFAQIGHLGFGVIALAGTLKHARLAGFGAAFAPTLEAIRNGRRTAWLPAQDWADLLPRPLNEVRAELGVRTPTAYQAAISRIELQPA